jgi:hypothetical protein
MQPRRGPHATGETARTATNPPPVVEILIGDNVAVLNPPLPWLLPHLEYQSRITHHGFRPVYSEEPQTVCQYKFDFRGRLVFNLGQLPRVLALLKERGIEARIEDTREPCPRMRPDPRVLADCCFTDRNLLETAAQYSLGRIEVGSPEQAFEQCLLLGRYWPEARIVVALPTYAAVARWWEMLEYRLQQKVWLSLSGVRRRGVRWHVATYAQVSPRDAGEWDILILPNGEQACGAKAIWFWSSLRFKRSYAFVRPGHQRDPHVDRKLEAMAGPVIHRVGRERVPVRVLLLRTPA